jgi:hypothetical protein
MDAMSPNDPAALVAAALASKPDLIVHEADRPETVRAVLKVLVQGGNLFDRGGVLVRLVRSPGGGAPVARQLTYNNVIVETHKHCQPVKFTADGNRVAITLPDAVARMLLDLGEWGLPPLAGVTTAPLLAADGSILVRAGYDRAHAMWCEPVPDLTVPIQPTRAEAEAALLLLRTAFRTFPFSGSPMVTCGEIMVVDISKPPSSAESAFLAALQTACCRASLWLSPGVLIVAPEVSGAGSGKGMLVRAICLIGFGCPPSAFTPGHDRQELDKRLVATLIEACPAVFLDNLNSTALRSNTLASVLTERPAHVRVMGRSEMVPLNCAAFVAVTGNGLSVSEDLARRFLEVLLDPQCEDPEARPFPKGFLNNLLLRRTELLGAVLTIWRWGRQNPVGLRRGLPLGSFETWAEWVRDPLLTLGCEDPVERIRAAKANDPRRRRTAELFATWWEHHKKQPVTAAELVEPVRVLIDPQGRGRQFVASRLMQMDGTRAGGFVLSRQPAAGKWGAYVVAQTAPEATDGIGHRDHREHGDETAASPDPMPPMDPMPYAGGDAGEMEGEL